MKTLVVAEIHEGKSRSATLSSITFAKEVSGGEFDILSIGEGAEDAAGELAGFGAGKVLTANIDGGYVSETYAPTLSDIVESGGYKVVTATSSAFGKDLLARVAAKLDAGLAPDVTAVSKEGDTLSFTRPMYAGNVIGKMQVNTDLIFATVRQSAFDPAEATGGSSATESVSLSDSPLAEQIEVLGLEVVESERPDLAEADIVVSGGRALKSAENFENILEPLVDALGAAMGASRAACDAGYVPNELQVGQTGKMVAPKLYIAVGISGAIQHLAGMKGSKTIVAINTDKEAPIAQVADYFWAADLFDAVPQLKAAIENA